MRLSRSSVFQRLLEGPGLHKPTLSSEGAAETLHKCPRPSLVPGGTSAHPTVKKSGDQLALLQKRCNAAVGEGNRQPEAAAAVHHF